MTTPPGWLGADWLEPGWLTASVDPQKSTGAVAVTSDNDTTIPNPQVPVGDGQVAPEDLSRGLSGGPGGAWVPSSSFPWPATPASGDGIVTVMPGAVGNGNGNDDPAGMPGYDGPALAYGGAYVQQETQGGLDAVAQRTTAWGFDDLQPGANMGYERIETRLIGNRAPGYVNTWWPVWNATPMRKTALPFTDRPRRNLDGTETPLPAYADLSLANSGGAAYYLNGPAAPQVSEAAPGASSSYDPAAAWA